MNEKHRAFEFFPTLNLYLRTHGLEQRKVMTSKVLILFQMLQLHEEDVKLLRTTYMHTVYSAVQNRSGRRRIIAIR